MNALAEARRSRILPKVAPPVAEQAESFWENVAETSWGRYVSEVERTALSAALEACHRPGVGLEVGCEGGRWCRMLSGRGWKMIGTDTNNDALRLCRQRDPSIHCIHVSHDEETLPVDSRSLDLLVCMEVPAIEQPWFVPEASRVLKQGGIFVGNFNNLLSWRGIAGAANSWMRGKHSFYPLTYATFRHAMRGRGFRFKDELGYCWPPFGRKSNSSLVSLTTKLERWSGVQKLPLISPWIVFIATLADAPTLSKYAPTDHMPI